MGVAKTKRQKCFLRCLSLCSKIKSHIRQAKGLKQEYNEVTKESGNIYYKGFSEEEIKKLDDYLQRVLKNVEEVL